MHQIPRPDEKTVIFGLYLPPTRANLVPPPSTRMPPNQNPEQVARDAIDAQLRDAGWAVQSRDAIDFHAGAGQSIREYLTDTGPADYVLFIAGQPVGVIEAKKETLGHQRVVPEEIRGGAAHGPA
jgi:type I restriction enzyme R subunit